MSLIDNHQLTTSEIDRLLRHVPIYVGTFPADSIPVVGKRPAAFVINTDPADEPGEHWTAIILKDGGKAIYFDPLGFPPLSKPVQSFLFKHASQGLKYSCITLQVPTGTACGYWCAAFIHHWSRGGSLPAFLSMFKGRAGTALRSNDLSLASWMTANGMSP